MSAHPKYSKVDRVKKLVDFVESHRASGWRISVYLSNRIPVFQKQVGKGYSIVPCVVDMGVSAIGK